jgi:hypothetical protein
MSPEKNSLAKWAEYGWLKAEPTSAEEIRDLLGIVNRDLADASVEAISDDRRFEAAFSAARTAANIALRSSGYRTATQPGHHQKTIESLELTIQADRSSANSEAPRSFQKEKRHQLRCSRQRFSARTRPGDSSRL